MNGPWSGRAGAWVGHNAAWQPIVTTVAVGVAGLSSDVRPALAEVSLEAGVSTARGGLKARTAGAETETTALPGRARATLAVSAATALAEQIAVVEIVTTGDGLAARPASADVASWAVAARAELSARAHAAAHSAVIGTVARLGIVCRPCPAGAVAQTEAMAEAVALSLVLRQCTAGTGIREVFRFDSPVKMQFALSSDVTTVFNFNSFVEVEKT